MKNSKQKLPSFFKPLFWSYNFSLMDSIKEQKIIIVNTINYGDWKHWQWIIDYYGKANVKRVIEHIPASEFRPEALKLICLLLKIKEMKYETRSDYIEAKKGIR